ncbi:MAG: hypothetical protein SGJ24_19400 [Chloroflexota bacterium]|nr:hypothetical protein [Chloroflexota bacterium]
MSFTISDSAHPSIRIMKITGELDDIAMTADEALGLNAGVPIYVLLDILEMSIKLPDGFLDTAQKSYFTNDNLAHLALFTRSEMFKIIGDMVARLTHRREKLSAHSTYAAAMAHLEKLAGV